MTQNPQSAMNLKPRHYALAPLLTSVGLEQPATHI